MDSVTLIIRIPLKGGEDGHNQERLGMLIDIEIKEVGTEPKESEKLLEASDGQDLETVEPG